MVCIVVLRLLWTLYPGHLVLPKRSSHFWTISSGEGTCPRMDFSIESSRREIAARVPCESSRSRSEDHLSRGGPAGE